MANSAESGGSIKSGETFGGDGGSGPPPPDAEGFHLYAEFNASAYDKGWRNAVNSKEILAALPQEKAMLEGGEALLDKRNWDRYKVGNHTELNPNKSLFAKNPLKSILPINHIDLYERSSIRAPKPNGKFDRWTREGGKDGTWHRFAGDANGEFHGNGSTVKGAGDLIIRQKDLPEEVTKAEREFQKSLKNKSP
jgi:hypothetical protein